MNAKIREEYFFTELDAFGALTRQASRLVKAREVKGVTYNPTEIARGSFSELAQIWVGFWVAKYQECTDNWWGLHMGFIFESCEGCTGSSLRQ